MLSDPEFEQWCAQLNLSHAAYALVAQVRAAEPVRRVGGRTANVCGRYPSLKMGKTIQFESHKVELPAIEAYEADAEVLEYYDQPIQLSLSFTSANGRTVRTRHVPDFLVLRRTSVAFEEWKPEKHLIELAHKQPNHYQQDLDGQWHNPPAEAAAALSGIVYRLRLDREINWIEHRNRQFLRSYRDGSYPIHASEKILILDHVTTTPGITIEHLLQSIPAASSDPIYALIATGQIYTDQRAVSLTEPTKVKLFRNLETAEAYLFNSPWQQVYSEIAPPGSNPSNMMWELFLKASPEDLRIANNRYHILESYLQGHPPQQDIVTARTIRRWKHQFKAAQQLYNWGYLGLLPHQSLRGNHTHRIDSDAWKLIDQVIADHNETLQQKGKLSVNGILVREW